MFSVLRAGFFSACVTAVVSLGLGIFMPVGCGADAIMVVRPLFGGLAFNLVLYAAVTAVVVAWQGLVSRQRGRLILSWQLPDQASPSPPIWLARLATLCAFIIAVGFSGRADRICVSDAGISRRKTVGGERFFPWKALSSVTVVCSFGDSPSQTMTISTWDGSKFVVRLRDIASPPASQIGFWDHVYDAKIPVKFGSFETGEINGTAGCWPLFPGLHQRS